MRKTRSRHNISRKGDDSNWVSTFEKIIQSGLNFICIVCDRCLCRTSVTLFSETEHNELISDLFNFICLHDSKFYICKTCAKKVNKDQIPCQAVCNERVLVARMLQFKKITIMPKGQLPNLKGAICNVPVDVVCTLQYITSNC